MFQQVAPQAQVAEECWVCQVHSPAECLEIVWLLVIAEEFRLVCGWEEPMFARGF